METALITGCNGFSGKALVRRLCLESGLRIVGCDLGEGPADGGGLDELIRLDMRDARRVSNVVGTLKPDLIFHLAGLFNGDERDLYEVNFMGGIHLIEAVWRDSPGSRVVVVGSAAEYGFVPEAEMPIVEEFPCRPAGPYGISKHALTLAARDYAQKRGVKAVVARPFNLVGAGIPSSLVVGALIGRLKQALELGTRSITVGNLDTERDFVSVRDAADAYLLMARGEQWGEVFNVCSGRPVSIRHLAQQLLDKATRPVSLVVDPGLVRSTDVRTVYGSYQKAERLLGFRPRIALEDALTEAWEYDPGKGTGSK